MKLHLITMGCPKNLVDSEKILAGIQGENVQLVNELDYADTIIVNTCGFIEEAKRESIETILSLVQLKKMGVVQRLLVTGCLSERYRWELLKQIPEIDGIWGVREMEKLPSEIVGFLGLPKRSPHQYDRIVTTKPAFAYLKIAEGCDNLCSFCAIPSIRGPHKSRSEQSILAEAQRLTENGIKELIVISQDTTYYGQDIRSDVSFSSLLQRMEKKSAAHWIRILYMYPERITDDLISVIADSEKICPYLDLPIQHISDRILRQMRRGTRRKKIEQLLDKLRSRISNLAVRTTFIVGFPGESDEEFEELFEFVQQFRFERLGVFEFSAEEGTDAAQYENQISEKVKHERYNVLMDLQHELSYSLNQNLVGKKLEIIVDEMSGDVALGRTKWDAPEIDNVVHLNTAVKPGSMVNAMVHRATAYDLYASICN